MVMRNNKAEDGSGKTHFNRVKKPGQSWTKLRDEARKRGTFLQEVGAPKQIKPKVQETDEV